MFFKVKIGYGADDFISITQEELPTAIKAQITGKVALFTDGSVSGNSILSITPDWNRVMGYKRQYKLTDEDYDEIGKKRIEKARTMIEDIKQKVLGIEPKKIPEAISEGIKQVAEKFKVKDLKNE